VIRRISIIAIALFAIACGNRDEPQRRRRERPAQREAETEERETPPAEDVVLVRRSRPIMSTNFQVTVAGMTEEEAGPLMERALDEIERIENVLSEWMEESEISAVNRAAGNGTPIRVGPDTLRVVEAGVEVSRWSDGQFDLSWAALRGLYTFQPGERIVPDIEEVRRRLTLVDWRGIHVDSRASTVRLEREGMALGTGGIGKGYALDRASAILIEGGANDFMLFGGGQVQVHGLRGDRPWRVGIQHPRDPERYVGFLEVTDASIATSGDYEHAFVDDDGRHWHHLIDLSTGLPATRSVQVTIIAPTGTYADALTKPVFMLGPERGLALLATWRERIDAVVIGPDLRMSSTPGVRDRLVMRVELEDGRLPGPTRFSPQF
jgi:thiamine biosynthesis lipoprotein